MDLHPFTVIGYWDHDERRNVVGVLSGEHEVFAGDNGYQTFVEYVEAPDPETAQAMIHNTSDTAADGDVPDPWGPALNRGAVS